MLMRSRQLPDPLPAPEAAPALRIRGLTVSYQLAPVLEQVDATFPRGALSAIVGPNGAGKSTLLKAALGQVGADSGTIRIAGAGGREALARLAYVPQAESVDWDFPITVAEVVAMGRYRSVGWFRRVGRSDRAIAAHCLERVGLAELARRQIGRLSGGQRQRVFLARALAQQAEVLLMDEPFAGIDARTQADLLVVLREIVDGGGSVIVVHHDLGQVRESFDWALLLNVRALACGPVAEVLGDDAVRRAYGLFPAGSGAAWAG